jgi:hypothetical protein
VFTYDGFNRLITASGRECAAIPVPRATGDDPRCGAFAAPHAGPPAAPNQANAPDLTAGYQVPNTGATVQLYISNLFNEGYRNFVGVPNIGRLALVQLKYDF